MKTYLVWAIVCLATAIAFSCMAGIYAATNVAVALAFAVTAGFALLAGVKWLADKR
jgi:hypothetical protein